MRFWIIALMLVPLAGCTDASDAADPATTDGSDDVRAAEDVSRAPPSNTGSDAFGWTLTVGAPGRGPEVALSGGNGAAFEVPEGVATLEVVAQWTCATPTCDLTIDLWAPGALEDPMDLLLEPATASGQGSGEVVLQVDAPESGEWHVSAHSDGATADVDGTFTWSIT